MNISNLIAPLNDTQREIVTAPIINMAVIAGAGSGKTRVLVHRIAWLMQVENSSPHEILAVTFTNKAAAEMRGRIEQLLRLGIHNMWIGTFHGIAHRLLRAHWQLAKLDETFQILDAEDQYRLIRRVTQSLNLDEGKWPARQTQWFINSKKDDGLRPHQVTAYNYFDEVMLQIYQTYDDLCQRASLVDFSELLLRCYEMLANNPDLLNHYQQRFQHILVDEFQDTNSIQYAWIKLMTGETTSVMIVGDDDQSIYSWRGAQVENIQRFNDDFPNSKVIRLEQNYRSTQTILNAANAVIAYNEYRLGKNLWTSGTVGESISVYTAFNEHDEARFIVSCIKSFRDQGETLNDIAILYRSNAQSRVLEEELLCAGIPYRVYGGQKFFERIEIKDTLAYLRLLINRHDDAAFERAVNTPTRGIGNTTLNLLRDYTKTHQLSLWRAAECIVNDQLISSRASNALSAFIELINKLDQDTKFLSLQKQTEYVIQASGLIDHFKKDRSDKAQSRIENLQELVQATQQFQYDDSLALPPLHAFLSYVALESGENQAEKHEDYVQLMTLHSAKGLEFEILFLAGMEEGLFPHKMSSDDPRRLEEERRLCYVGMTRAKRKLYLTHAETRRVNGNDNLHLPSRFLQEIPKQLVEEVRMKTRIARPISTHVTTSISIPNLGIKLGQRVLHATFGEGVVLNYEGQGPQARIQVKFHDFGIKWLVAEYAKLETL